MIIPTFPLPFWARPLKREIKLLGDGGGGVKGRNINISLKTDRLDVVNKIMQGFDHPGPLTWLSLLLPALSQVIASCAMTREKAGKTGSETQN